MNKIYVLCMLIIASGYTFGCKSKSKMAETPALSSASLPDTLNGAIDGSPYRSPENVTRDQYRHPLQTLEFFGINPSMTVVEVWPGNGWYAEILAPYLAKQGRYIAAVPTPASDEMKTRDASLKKWFQSHPEVPVTWAEMSVPTPIQLGEDSSADLVVTFRNVHNWMSRKGENEAFQAFFRVLKPGGVLGVVEHRGSPKKSQAKQAGGYVREDVVIALARKAGFRFVASSPINSNPKDTKDYAEGVWALPPVLRNGDKDRDKYVAIGESDRMTLKFQKPKSK